LIFYSTFVGDIPKSKKNSAKFHKCQHLFMYSTRSATL